MPNEKKGKNIILKGSNVHHSSLINHRAEFKIENDKILNFQILLSLDNCETRPTYSVQKFDSFESSISP